MASVNGRKKQMPNAWKEWQVRKKLGEVVEQACTSGPQKITRKGKLVAVVVELKTWSEMNSKRKSKKTDKVAKGKPR
jgi:prevent-host-death family protein